MRRNAGSRPRAVRARRHSYPGFALDHRLMGVRTTLRWIERPPRGSTERSGTWRSVSLTRRSGRSAGALASRRFDLVTTSACVRKPGRLLLGSHTDRRCGQVDFSIEPRTGAVGFRRLALDLVLANEPQRKRRTGQAEEAGEGEHVV